MMLHDLLVRFQPLEQCFKSIARRNQQSGHVAASHSEVPENILSQFLQLFHAFFASKNGHRVTVLPDNVRILAKIMFEIAGTVIATGGNRSEEHTSELQSLLRISYAVFCLTKQTYENTRNSIPYS